MPFPRSSGILLHPTSFPNRFGMGDLGLEAYRFVDFLAKSKQKLWQILPLGPYGNAPYMSYSALAGNPLLISLEILVEKGLLDETDLNNIPEFSTETVDFDGVKRYKMPLLRKACDRFKNNASSLQQKHFEGFCDGRADWLDDYALFMALTDKFEGASWHNWDRAIAFREPAAIEHWQQQLAAEIFFHKYTQFEFFYQWSDLKRYANMRGIQIFGDIPIYVSDNSVDVWANKEIFCLDKHTGEAELRAGVPPDYFSETGQLWGNPVYNWEELSKQNFKWWVQRFQSMLDYVDLIRIDHFRGFEAYWVVKKGETTAMNGEWLKAPGEAFFELLKQKLGKLPIIAEDLGIITPEVEALRDRFEFPGMKILHFAFGGSAESDYLPHNYPRNCVVYAGTHDNDTTVGWFEKLSQSEKDMVVQYLGGHNPKNIHWDMIRLSLSSVGNQVIIPLQDLMGLGSEARMNIPGKIEGNWGWRYRAEALTAEISDRLRNLTELYGRA